MDETDAPTDGAKPTQMTLEREVTEGDRTYQVTATAMPDGRTAICFLSGATNSDQFNELSGVIAKEDLAIIARAFRPELTGIAAWHGVNLESDPNGLAALRLKHPNAYMRFLSRRSLTGGRLMSCSTACVMVMKRASGRRGALHEADHL